MLARSMVIARGSEEGPHAGTSHCGCTLRQDRGVWRGNEGVREGAVEIFAPGLTSGLDPQTHFLFFFLSVCVWISTGPPSTSIHVPMVVWLVGWWGGGGPGNHADLFRFGFILFFETSLSGARWGRAMQEAERSGSPPPSSAITSSPNQPTGRRLQVRDEPRGHECFTVCSKKSNILGGDTHPVALGCKYFFFHNIDISFFYFFLL